MFNKKIITIAFLFLGVLLYFGFFSLSNKISAATPPTVITVLASDITGGSVTLNGNVTDDGDSLLVIHSFEYGETTDYELTPVDVMILCDPFDGCPLGAYSGSVSDGLTCETEYHYRAFAQNEAGLTGYGDDMTFTTGACPLPAVVTTHEATNIGLNSATLNGSIDFTESPLNQVGFSISLIDSPNPLANFDYFWQETENQPYEMGETFSLTMNNLSCSSTYTYSADGGEDVTFDTLSCDPPVVETGEPIILEEPITKIPSRKIFAFLIPLVSAAPGDTVVQLNGNIIDTGGEDPVAGFEYGLDTSYGSTLEVGTFGVEPYSSDLSSLAFDTIYHYRAYATNSADTSYGEDQTFMIASPTVAPTVATNTATSISQNTAVLNGEITDTGGENSTTRGFDYGLTDSYGMNIEENGSFPSESFSGDVSGLVCNNTYHYRAYARNSVDRGNGEDQTFTTNRCPTSSGNIPLKIIFTPRDLCINIDGIQEVVPSGMELNSDGDCVNVNILENPPIDICPNIDGFQEIIPKNMEKNKNGDCSSTDQLIDNSIDICPNIEKIQEVVPSGMELNSDGDCVNVNILENPPIDICPNIDGFQEIIPAEMKINKNNDCIFITENEKEKESSYLFGFILSFMGIITGVYISFVTNLFAGPISFKELNFIPAKFGNLILAFLGLRKNKVPWGIVYDSVTKQPLDPAYVVLLDLQGKEVATSITDLDGRYGFLVPAGKYKITANKTNYKFPSEKLKDQTRDELYQDLYDGGIIDVQEGKIVAKNIPMDPLNFDWNEFEKKDKKLMNFFSQKQVWMTRISDTIFYLGFIVTLISVTISPITYNIVILAVYVILYFLKKTVLKSRAYGSIKDKKSNNPLSFAVIKIFFPGSEHEVTHKVADKTGKYYCLVPNGTYYAKIENKNVDESYSLVHTSEPIEIKKGYINKKFEI